MFPDHAAVRQGGVAQGFSGGGLRVEARTGKGARCALEDRSGDALPRAELERLLGELVAAGAFGFRARSRPGGAMPVGTPQFAHVQVAGKLYRLIIERRLARLEKF